MPAGLPVAILLLAEAGSAPLYGPPAPSKPRPPAAAPAKPAEDSCAAVVASANPREIIVCAQKPQGYRIDPSVMQARREIRSGGRPTPSEKFRNTKDCATIGPMGCRGGAAINIPAAVITAVTMVKKAVSGDNVGEMFITDPHPTEYQLYVAAKKRRDAEDAEKAAKAKAAAAAASETKPPQ